MQPAVIVRKAAMMRWAHYVNKGVLNPLPWSRLTDAQKAPWLSQASRDDGS